MEKILQWLDDKTLVIIGVIGLCVFLGVMYPEVLNEHFAAVLAGLFGIVTGVSVTNRGK